MADIVKLDRRDFIKIGAMTGGGLLLGVYLPDHPQALAGPPLQPNVFVRIDADETIAIWVGKADMGQGVRTSLPMASGRSMSSTCARTPWSSTCPTTAIRRRSARCREAAAPDPIAAPSSVSSKAESAFRRSSACPE